MKNIRYIQLVDHLGYEKVCQLQYDEEFIQEVEGYAQIVANIKASERNEDNSFSLNVFGQKGIKVAFGNILNDDRQEGEFYEMDSTEVLDGLPDETSFDPDVSSTLNNIVIWPSYIDFIGYDENGDEVSAEILIDDLKPFVR